MRATMIGIRAILFSVILGVLASAVAQEVRFGYVEWPEAVVKTEVVAGVLEALGYETRSQSLSLPLVLEGVSTGDLDVFVETWWPSMTSLVTPYLEEGSVTLSARNLEGTLYRAAVPTYVYEAGVTSLADLAANAERFGSAYYGIEPGNDGNEIMRRAIEADLYSLSDWTLVESSEQGMLAAVGRAVRQEEWIVFSGWRPHWMNSAFEMSYLDDPEGIWGGEGYVATVANTAFLEQNPNLERFFRQVRVTLADQEEWIDLYGRQGQDPQGVADGWIRENLTTVLAWAEGVTATDGEAAGGVLKAAFGTSAGSN